MKLTQMFMKQGYIKEISKSPLENKLFNAMERESLKGANGFQIFTFATQIQHTAMEVLLLH